MAPKELIWTEKNTDSRRKARENKTKPRNQSKQTINTAVGKRGKTFHQNANKIQAAGRLAKGANQNNADRCNKARKILLKTQTDRKYRQQNWKFCYLWRPYLSEVPPRLKMSVFQRTAPFPVLSSTTARVSSEFLHANSKIRGIKGKIWDSDFAKSHSHNVLQVMSFM